MSVWQTFAQGGVWMYLIALGALALAALLAVQHRDRRGRDLRWVIAGLVATIAVAGPLGSLVGIVQAFGALEALPPDQRTEAMLRAVGIAATPTAWSGLVLAVAALPVGYVASRVRREA